MSILIHCLYKYIQLLKVLICQYHYTLSLYHNTPPTTTTYLIILNSTITTLSCTCRCRVFAEIGYHCLRLQRHVVFWRHVVMSSCRRDKTWHVDHFLRGQCCVASQPQRHGCHEVIKFIFSTLGIYFIIVYVWIHPSFMLLTHAHAQSYSILVVVDDPLNRSIPCYVTVCENDQFIHIC